MSITKFIVQNISTEKGKNVIQTENTCVMCGGSETNDRPFIQKNQQFSAKFNDINECTNKESNVICGYCQFCLDGKSMDSPNGKRCSLRLYSFYADKNDFKVIDRSEMEYYLFEKQYYGDFVLAFSETGQKHISFKSKISNDTNKFYVCTDTEGNILFDRKKRINIYKRLKELYLLGVPKKTFLGNIDPRRMKKYGITFEDIPLFKKYSNNKSYQIIVNSLTKNKKS